MIDVESCVMFARLESNEGERSAGHEELRGRYEKVTISEICNSILSI